MSDPSPTRHARPDGGTPASLYLACGALTVLILGIDLAMPAGLAMGVPYIAAVILALRSPKRRFVVFTAITCSAYTLVAAFHKAAPGGWGAVLTDRVVALFAIWVTALLAVERRRSDEQREHAIQEREKALADVRVLRGLLPICASCKQIRDDDGYWTQIEVYIRDHSEAQFSHGICPACARKLYPDFYEANPSEPESRA
jgi:hypothetical protein